MYEWTPNDHSFFVFVFLLLSFCCFYSCCFFNVFNFLYFILDITTTNKSTFEFSQVFVFPYNLSVCCGVLSLYYTHVFQHTCLDLMSYESHFPAFLSKGLCAVAFYHIKHLRMYSVSSKTKIFNEY